MTHLKLNFYMLILIIITEIIVVKFYNVYDIQKMSNLLLLEVNLHI